MNKKIILGAAAALAFAGCVSAVPLVATADAPPPEVCVTSVTVGSGQILSRCPTSFRTGDRRGVSPGAPT